MRCEFTIKTGVKKEKESLEGKGDEHIRTSLERKVREVQISLLRCMYVETSVDTCSVFSTTWSS